MLSPVKKVIFVHLFWWLGLSTAWFFITEPGIKKLFTGFHNVTLFLLFLSGGLMLIFIVVATSLILRLVKRRRQIKIAASRQG